jgi:type II secretion system protein C
MTNDRQISRLLRAAKAVLVLALLYGVVEVAKTHFRLDTAFKPKTVAGEGPARSRVGVASDDEPPADYSAIVDNDVFAGGLATANPSVSSAAAVVLSGEELGLKLTGTFAGDPAVSRAIIENSETKATSICRIGDVVASATIQSIEPDRVILLHAGQKRVLLLHAAAATTSLAQTTETEKPPVARTEAIAGLDAQDSYPPTRLGYVENLFREATIEPCPEDGQSEGLKITGLEKIPWATVVGLRNGDIVRTVNGQSLTSKQKAFQVLQKARTQSKLEIQLVRDGETKDLSFDL